MQDINYILVGDQHAKPDNLADLGLIIDWIVSLCIKYNAAPIFLGDAYDDHGVAKIAVQDFWHKQFKKFTGDNYPFARYPIVISGNHDMPYDCSSSWMEAHTNSVIRLVSHVPGIYCIDHDNKIYAMSYVKDNEKFIEVANKIAEIGGKWLICHQEFNGCQLENGYYSPNGVDPKRLNRSLKIISGHIHKRQMLDYDDDSGFRICYPGTPRQLIRSDIAEVKGVTLWEATSDKFTFIPTPEEISGRFKYYQIDKSNVHLIDEVPYSSKVYVDIKGSKDFINEVTSKLPPFAKVRTFPDKESSCVDIKESEGVSKAFMGYFAKFVKDRELASVDQAKVLDKVFTHCPMLKD